MGHFEERVYHLVPSLPCVTPWVLEDVDVLKERVVLCKSMTPR